MKVNASVCWRAVDVGDEVLVFLQHFAVLCLLKPQNPTESEHRTCFNHEDIRQL